MVNFSQEDIVDRIYEASVLPDFWPEVLKHFARAAECRVAAMIATDGKNLKWIGCSPEAEKLAKEHYEFPGGMTRSNRLMATKHLGFLTDRDVFTEEEILAEPLYTDYLIPNGYGRGLATAIDMPHGETIIINAEGDYSLGLVDDSLKLRLDGLRPHLARSALLSSRLSFERARTSVETLAALGFAACAVKANGAVLVANAEFERGEAFWTTRLGGRIALHDRRADQQLADSLGVLSAAGVRSIAVRSQVPGPPAALHIVPVRRAAHDLFNLASAILVLTQTASGPTPQTPLLQALFDLTATEADLAARIGAGQTIEQVARADAKAVETVRSQLKSVLAKTGCRRQTDLVRLLVQLVPAAT